MAALGKFPKLRVLTLQGTPITDEAAEHLTGLACLETLGAANTALTGSGLERLAQMPNLGRIDVGRTKATIEDLVRFAQARPGCSVDAH